MMKYLILCPLRAERDAGADVWRASAALPAAWLFIAMCAASGPAAGAFVESDEDAAPENQTLLLADEIEYDSDANTVSARGHVEVQRGERLLLADTIVFNRSTDIATAVGNVAMIDDTGSVFFFERIQLTGDLKEGLASEVRVLLSDKSRMASRTYRRLDTGINELYDAVYTPCDSCAGNSPLWQIKANQVRYDREGQMVYYRDAWLEMGGIPVFYTPYLAHPDPTAGGMSGLLLPSLGASRNLGAFYKQPYYIRIAPDRDATIAPFITTDAGQGATVEYRQDFRTAQIRASGSLMANDPDLAKDIRGHFEGWARWDLDEHWRTGTEINLSSDRTYLRRYNFEAPTWLTSNLFAERFSRNSYFSANAYYFQRQRVAISRASVPAIAPLLDFNYVSDPDSWGGYWNFDANGLVLFRETGTDSNRLSARLGWNLPYTSSYGAIYTVRADVRADGYYVRNRPRARHADIYTGTAGRIVPKISLKWQMPFVSDLFGFHQLAEPIVMAIVSPTHVNPESIPNEDSLDLEFDDTNLFGLDRFSGLDRVETGARINYGLNWAAFNQSVGTVSALFGQSYRFHDDPTFAPLSGLRGHLSDYVGHLRLTPSPYFSVQYRFRLDKDNLASRRGEVNAGFGPDLLRVSASYIFVKADGTLAPAFGSTEEIYASVSSRFSQHWSINASHRHNLGRNGGSIRTNVGVSYEDECFVVGLDLANDHTQDRDFRRGIALLLRFNLKTIGDIKFNTDISARR